MAGRLIAIGDIHGCRLAFEALLGALAPRAEDKLIFLGDYVDRGPESWGVVERVLTLGQECSVVPILGNHEEMLLAALTDRSSLRLWLGFGGDATIESYRRARENLPPLQEGDTSYRLWRAQEAASAIEIKQIPMAHLAFLKLCVNYFETPTHLFVHANCRPDRKPADESEQTLRWEAVDTRWAKAHASGKTLIVGHTAQRSGQILDLGFLKCIDTYCHGGGFLTALEVQTGEVWQADREGRMVTQTRLTP